MKKTSKIFFAVASVLALFSLVSCKDAIVDDGANVKSYVNGDAGVNGGVPPFSMYADTFDCQIWKDYNGNCVTATSDGALVITQTGTWYGVALCSNAAGNDKSAKYRIYDMSEVASITFEAKASVDDSKLNFSVCTEDAETYTLSTEWKKFEYDCEGKTHIPENDGVHYCMISLVQNATTDSVTHYIKNIAFFDDGGNEIVPTIVKSK